MVEGQRPDWHRDWLALDDQRVRQLDVYCDINRELERQPGWFRLSQAEKAKAQRLGGLIEAETLLHLLERRVNRALRTMPRGPSRNYDAILANLKRFRGLETS